MVTVGMVLTGVVLVGNGEGFAGVAAGGIVGTSVGVFDWVGMTVNSVGSTVDTAVAVGASVGGTVAVGG